MLAMSKPMASVPAGWIAEPKLDGWRAIVSVCDGRVRVRSRRGTDLTDRLPELSTLSAAVPDGTVLDGELIAGEGRSTDFYSLGPRLMAKSPTARARWTSVPLSFQAFDILHCQGDDLCRSTWSDRRVALNELHFHGANWGTLPALDEADLADALAACVSLGLEGLVLKRCASIYRPGERSKDWIKVKTPDWRERHAGRRHER